MSKSEEQWSLGFAHKLELAWRKQGGTAADASGLVENSRLIVALLGVLRGTHEIKPKAFPIWRTVTLGAHKTPEAYLASIQGRGRQISSWAREIAEKVTCAQQESQLPLVDVLDRDIGLTEVYTTREFYERAATFGLYRCPAEAGLALADQFDDQPQGDYRRIAMEAIEDSGGGLDLFCVSRDEDERWLEAGIGHPQDRWDPGSRWVLTTSKP